MRLTMLLKHILLMPVLGCGGSAPAPPAPAPPPPQLQDAAVTAAADAERNRRRAAASNTILTGSQGVTGAAPVATKSLLGA